MFKRKTNWAKLMAGVVALNALPKKPIAGIAVLLGGGYLVYRALIRNTHARSTHGMQVA
jgi:hypothetical protein